MSLSERMDLKSPISLPMAACTSTPLTVPPRKTVSNKTHTSSVSPVLKALPPPLISVSSLDVSHNFKSDAKPPGFAINSIDNKEHLINATLSNIYSDTLHDNYFPGIASLIDSLDRPIMVHLRDRKTIIGCLSSIDSYGNLLLSDTVERVYAMDFHADIPRGVYIVRGENVALAGEIDLQSEDKERVKPLQQVLAWQEAEKLGREEKKRRIRHMSYEAGILHLDDSLEDDFYQ